jgi:hypothetical protein
MRGSGIVCLRLRAQSQQSTTLLKNCWQPPDRSTSLNLKTLRSLHHTYTVLTLLTPGLTLLFGFVVECQQT